MEVLEKTFRDLILIRGIVFDGLGSNITFASKAGAELNDLDNLKTFFSHPCTNTNVYIIFDAVHMFKLARNYLGEIGSIIVPNFN